MFSSAAVSARHRGSPDPRRWKAARTIGVRGVAEQGHPAKTPARQAGPDRHREFEHVIGARMKAGTSSHSKCQSAKGR